MAKKQCGVCYKNKETECSHVECPNRRVLSADLPGDGVGMDPESPGYWWAKPTTKDEWESDDA